MSLSSATSIFPQRNRTYVPTEVLQRHAPLTSQRTRSTTTHITRTIWYGTLASRGQGSSACLPLQPTDPQAQRARRANCLQQQQPAISNQPSLLSSSLPSSVNILISTMSTSHGPDNDDMTMPEREQWLLDRGVQIEKSGSGTFEFLFVE
jgi:hypothetical protein